MIGISQLAFSEKLPKRELKIDRKQCSICGDYSRSHNSSFRRKWLCSDKISFSLAPMIPRHLRFFPFYSIAGFHSQHFRFPFERCFCGAKHKSNGDRYVLVTLLAHDFLLIRNISRETFHRVSASFSKTCVDSWMCARSQKLHASDSDKVFLIFQQKFNLDRIIIIKLSRKCHRVFFDCAH